MAERPDGHGQYTAYVPRDHYALRASASEVRHVSFDDRQEAVLYAASRSGVVLHEGEGTVEVPDGAYLMSPSTVHCATYAVSQWLEGGR